jgi:hypothetical protein
LVRKIEAALSENIVITQHHQAIWLQFLEETLQSGVVGLLQSPLLLLLLLAWQSSQKLRMLEVLWGLVLLSWMMQGQVIRDD